MLLRAHRHRLREQDLEDCYGQATLELLAAVLAGRRFAGRVHLANVLEQRFVSRVRDRRRALAGRSSLQAALEGALSLGEVAGLELEIRDRRAEVDQLVARRLELSRILELAPQLSRDQRLVLASQTALQMGRGEFCARFGWSYEKYRKVAQRGRARLRALMDADQSLRVVAHDARPGVSPRVASNATEGCPGRELLVGVDARDHL